MTQKTLADILKMRDIRTEIGKYTSGACDMLTKNEKGVPYAACVPPFTYRDTETGKIRDCTAECRLHITEWLVPLLEAMPDLIAISSKSEDRALELTSVHHDFKIPMTFDVHNNVIKPNMEGKGLTAKQAVASWQKVNRHVKYADLVLLLPFLFAPSVEYAIVTREAYRVSFPGNPLWNHFARLVRPYSIMHAFSVRIHFF